jgi:hypothetical protein
MIAADAAECKKWAEDGSSAHFLIAFMSSVIVGPGRVYLHALFCFINLVDNTMLMVQTPRVEAIAIGQQLLEAICWAIGILL